LIRAVPHSLAVREDIFRKLSEKLEDK